ncbi:MAG: 4Fe-4S dicluster domain-containing protein [Bacteroidales bacterium]|nr:4Fe-4S dicluster domain-containing protein [Bacteroidales bacterium]
MARINPGFKKEIQKYGSFDFNACYNCGNCTAVCSLTDAGNSFPRKMLRDTVLGLEDDLKSSVEPWLCYYCGDCSTTCPREADPALLMMSLRRWLTAKYDWTGLSGKFYTSKRWEIGAILTLSVFILLLFVFFHGPMTTELTPEGGVALNTFAPWQAVEIGDWAMAGLLSFFLISNIVHMYFMIVRKSRIRIPLKLYLKEFWALIFHFATQWRFSKCESESGTRRENLKKGKYNYWVVHFLLMSGYVILFTMIVGMLGWFQTDEIHPWWHPQRMLGYYATFGLLIGTIYFSYLRIKKNNEKTKHSHYTDWTFLILLFLTTVTGILVHLFRINGMPYLTYYIYVIHLMVLFPMLMIEVPFSKWSHLAYRPFAIYFNNLVLAARKQNAA